MADPYLPAPREFRDLVPWADPYIASLLKKLGRESVAEEGWLGDTDFDDQISDDLPPPLDKDDRQSNWPPDWTERQWPRG